MAEISKSVANRILISRTVITALEQDGPGVAASLEELFLPDGGPENLTVAMVIAAMGPALDRVCREMARLDAALAVEVADDDTARDTRDDAKDALTTAVDSVRSLVDGTYGPDATGALGLPSVLPADAEELIQTAGASADLLETTDLGAPAPGVTLDREACAARLRTAAEGLDVTLKSVATEEREAQAARTARDGSMTRWQQVYSGLADAFAGFAHAVGALAVANRTRPTSRRRQGNPEPQDTGNPTGAGPAAGPTGGPTS